MADLNLRKPEKSDEEVIALFGAQPLSNSDHIGFFSEWLDVKHSENNEVDKNILFGESGQSMASLAEQGKILWQHIAHQQIELQKDSAINQQQQLATVTFNVLQLVSRWFCLFEKSQLEQLFDKDGFIVLFNDQTWHKVQSLLTSCHLKHDCYIKQWFNNIKFTGSLENCYFNYSYISQCAFHSIYIQHCFFNCAEIADIDIYDCKFEYCYFVNMPECRKNHRVDHIYYQNANSIFFVCDFSGTNLTLPHGGENSKLIRFRGCNFEDTKFQGVPKHLLDIE